MSVRRVSVWTCAGVLVVLLARTIGYAAAPSPAAHLYARNLGGPSLPLMTLVALSLAAIAAIAVCWLATLGVRERRLLERRVLANPPPRIGAVRLLANAFAFWVVCSLASGLVEATIHWRAGLGWHGLHCLVGPVHRNLIPIVGALALLASACIAAGDHVVSWLQRRFALLRGAVPTTLACWVLPVPRESLVPRARFRAARAGARAPPAAAA
jgi:hypothetical protein